MVSFRPETAIITSRQIVTDNMEIRINVKNAGLVLLNNYIPLLFKRLNITTDSKFVNETTQSEAVHYLQYVVTGLSQTDDSLVSLNKILCGLPLSSPVKCGFDISEESGLLVNGLIEAVINHWSAIGSSSVQGFRNNWLVRDGALSEKYDCWELTVSKRSYDILLNKAPFSFSTIKYPWMIKPLHINW